MKLIKKIFPAIIVAIICLVCIIAINSYLGTQYQNESFFRQIIVIAVFLLIAVTASTLLEAVKHKKVETEFKNRRLHMEDLALKHTLSLKESEERFKTLIERAPAAVHIMDPKGNFLEVNQSMCQLHGYTREEFLSMSVVHFFLALKYPEAQDHIYFLR